MVFSGVGTPETVPTGSDGIATYQAATETDAVDVTFESAKSLSDVMKPIWKQRQPATAPEDYVKPSAEITVVASRAKAIETEDGGAFPGFSMKSGTKKTLSVRPTKKRAVLVELHDTLFRTDSAVVMPEGEAPASTVGEHESITTVGLIATILRYNEEHEGKKLFIAGHTDRAGNEGDNVTLSEHRAKAVLALVEGNRDAFIKECTAKHTEVDVTQLFDWTHNNPDFNFACKPTTLKAAPSDENYYLFRKSYNAWVKGAAAASETRGTKIGETGRVQPDIWGAMFDLYEYGLRKELGEDEDGVAALRSPDTLKWVDDSKKTIGFGEKHPTAKNTVDGTRSQADRRVEVLLFEEDDAPDLAASNGSDVYDGVTYGREAVKPLDQFRDILVRLCDPTGLPLGNTSYKAFTHGFNVQGQTDTKGWATLKLSGGYKSVTLDWDWPDAPTESGRKQSSILALKMSDGDEGVCQRLSDLGFQASNRPLSELLTEYRAEFGTSLSENLNDLKESIRRWHAGGDRPERFADQIVKN